MRRPMVTIRGIGVYRSTLVHHRVGLGAWPGRLLPCGKADTCYSGARLSQGMAMWMLLL